MPVPKEWKDRHKGQRCFILASGLSVKQIDLSLLRGELVISVNKSYLGMIGDYHCISDGAAMRYWSKDLHQLAPKTKMIFSSPPCRKFTAGAYTIPLNMQQLHQGGKLDLNLNQTWWGRSVVLDLALPFAAYLGCRRIYLLGCDCDGSGHFYDPEPAKHVRYILGDGIFKNYQKFKELFAAVGGEIFISTPKSKLGMFRYVKFEDLFYAHARSDTSKGRVQTSPA